MITRLRGFEPYDKYAKRNFELKTKSNTTLNDLKKNLLPIIKNTIQTRSRLQHILFRIAFLDFEDFDFSSKLCRLCKNNLPNRGNNNVYNDAYQL